MAGRWASAGCFHHSAGLQQEDSAGAEESKKKNLTVVVGLQRHYQTGISRIELATKANDLLVAEHAKKFSLNQSDAQFIDFAVALRNFLGHRSAASRTALKDSVTGLTESPNAVFKGSIRDVGSYIKSKDGNGTTRAVAFASRLITISELL